MKPCQKPKHARTAANATMSQSSTVTRHVLPLPDRRPRPTPAPRAPGDRDGAAWRLRSARSSAPNHGSSSAHALAQASSSPGPRGDYAGMYSDIDASSQQTTSLSRVRRRLPRGPEHGHRHRACAVAGKARDVPGGLVAVPVRVHTRLFGTLALAFDLRTISGRGGEGTRIAWSPSLAFPGLRPGRAAEPPHHAAAARDAARARRQRAGRKPRSRPRRHRRSPRRPRPQLAARRTGERGARDRRARSPPRGARRSKPKGCPPTRSSA